MKKLAKPLVLVAILLLFLSSAFLGCNRNYEEFAITEVKYEVQCGYVFLCWYTTEPAISTIYTCTLPPHGVCSVVAVEPEMGTLHQISLCTDETVEKYQIKTTNAAGEEDWQEFANPYLTK
jgi:hypothetical protein